MDNAASSTRQKALALNLDATAYGTFAEIGGGQEVAILKERPFGLTNPGGNRVPSPHETRPGHQASEEQNLTEREGFGTRLVSRPGPSGEVGMTEKSFSRRGDQ
jgi:hypothetical protein